MKQVKYNIIGVFVSEKIPQKKINAKSVTKETS